MPENVIGQAFRTALPWRALLMRDSEMCQFRSLRNVQLLLLATGRHSGANRASVVVGARAHELEIYPWLRQIASKCGGT
jgi:hypothetical protein